nr:zinc-ribbon domain-containing protein [bacterium]
MAFCGKCGAQLADGAKFCPACGAAVEQPAQPQQASGNAFQNMMNTPDSTGEYDQADINANKAMAVLSYIGILFLVPLFAAKNSKFARFHVNQGLVLCIAEVIYGIAYSILSSIILAISWKLYFLVQIIGIVSLAFLALAIIGIVNAANGKAKELPLIGNIKILK